jgi:membrane protein
MFQKSIDVVKKLVVETYKDVIAGRLTLHSAAIAFYTIFSAAPMLIILLFSTKLLLGHDQTMNALSKFLTQLAGSQIAQSLLNLTQASSHLNAGFLATAVTVAVLIFGATTVIIHLKRTLNAIFNISRPEINSLLLYIINRIVALVIIILLAAFFLGSLLLEAKASFFGVLFRTYLPHFFYPLLNISPAILSFVMSVIFFTLVFRLLPDVHVYWKDIFVGACVTAIFFLLGKELIGLYLNNSSMQTSYKAAGAFIIFLIWIYYNVLIILVGAEFTETYTRIYGSGIKTSWNDEFFNWRSFWSNLRY